MKLVKLSSSFTANGLYVKITVQSSKIVFFMVQYNVCIMVYDTV